MIQRSQRRQTGPRRGIYLLLVAGLLGLSACQPPPAPPDRLKIGTLLPITGDLSPYGSAMQDTAQWAVDTANACGGVLGQPIALVAADDQTDPAAASAAMTKLTERSRDGHRWGSLQFGGQRDDR